MDGESTRCPAVREGVVKGYRVGGKGVRASRRGRMEFLRQLSALAKKTVLSALPSTLVGLSLFICRMRTGMCSLPHI